jgi:cytoskeletal protein RodZ
MKAILPIFLLVLIIIGIGLLSTQNVWVQPFATWILSHDSNYVAEQKLVSVTASSTSKTNPTKTHKTPQPAPRPAVAGTLKGTMTIGPICPVEQVDHPCKPTPEMYAAHPVSVYTSDRSKLVATLTPDANGNFSTALPAGTYLVDTQHQRIGSVQGVPTTLTVTSGQSVTISISVDTGIR